MSANTNSSPHTLLTVTDSSVEFVDPNIIELLQKADGAVDELVTIIEADIESIDSYLDNILSTSEADAIRSRLKKFKNDILIERAALESKLERMNSPYVISNDLAQALGVARRLGKPLLLEGEPGTGKTSLAYALAGQENLDITHCQCKSTTSASDLLYEIDTLQKLQDAYLAQTQGESKDLDDRNYVKYGPLGEVILKCAQWREGDPVPVLLIDEVDKASRDFSNDLLHEIDKMSFFIKETDEEICARIKPIVIITSNHEKDLPEPFLRRCAWSYIDFPDAEQMSEIVHAHLPDVSQELLNSALKKFYQIRENESIQKKPSTSEFLDWIKILVYEGIGSVDKIAKHHLGLLLKLPDDQSVFLSGDSEDLNEKETGIPNAVLFAVQGKHIVKINEATPNVYTTLAEAGIKFRTESGTYGYDNYKPFSILTPGCKNIDDKGMMEVSEEVFNILFKHGKVDEIYIVEKKGANGSFGIIEDSSGDCLHGKDEKGEYWMYIDQEKVVRKIKKDNSGAWLYDDKSNYEGFRNVETDS